MSGNLCYYQCIVQGQLPIGLIDTIRYSSRPYQGFLVFADSTVCGQYSTGIITVFQ